MSGRFSMIPWKLKLTWKKAYRVMAVAADKDDVDYPSARDQNVFIAIAFRYLLLASFEELLYSDCLHIVTLSRLSC